VTPSIWVARIALALTFIAIGAGGVALYLRNNP